MLILSEICRSRSRSSLSALGACALVLLLLGARPAAAQQTDDDETAKNERIAATYRLTEPVLKKVAMLVREFVELARRDPSLLRAAEERSDERKSLPPAVQAVFKRVGITEDEYEKFAIAMGFAALGTWAADQSPEAAQQMKQTPAVVRANMAFLKTHEGTLKAIEADMKVLKEKSEEQPKEPPARDNRHAM